VRHVRWLAHRLAHGDKKACKSSDSETVSKAVRGHWPLEGSNPSPPLIYDEADPRQAALTRLGA
jgi:hypothetical protein